jgi:lipopolysaccharide transport system ATP-binding protein
MTHLLTLDNVSLSFDMGANIRYDALSSISLQIAAGDRVGVLGANGSGKSTLLKIMAKIFEPETGRVEWAPNVTASLLTLGLGFRPDLSGRDNAYLSCLLMGLSSEAASSCLNEIESFCELGSFFDQPVKFYSTGMRARLAFGSALLNQSQVLLIDEVLSVGDNVFRKKAKQALEEQLSPERAVIIVSHNLGQISSLADTAILMERGEISASGAVDDVLEVYQRSTVTTR